MSGLEYRQVFDTERTPVVEWCRRPMNVLPDSYPPSAVLNYVWPDRPHAQNPVRNVYSSQGTVFFVDTGGQTDACIRDIRVNGIDL